MNICHSCEIVYDNDSYCPMCYKNEQIKKLREAIQNLENLKDGTASALLKAKRGIQQEVFYQITTYFKRRAENSGNISTREGILFCVALLEQCFVSNGFDKMKNANHNKKTIIEQLLMIRPITFDKEEILAWLKGSLEQNNESCAQEGLPNKLEIDCNKFIEYVLPFLETKQ